MDNVSHTLNTSKPVGYIHIDDTRFNHAVGGIRLIQGVNKDEVIQLAEAMSLKLHIFGFPISGAKGGINSDEITDFYDFVAHPDVKKLISGKNKFDIQMITGPDIGTSEEEYYVALEKAGLSHLIRKGLLSRNSENYGLPLDNVVTAYGAIIASDVVLSPFGYRLLEDKRVKVVIEGFGKVGTGIAAILNGKAKIVGVSTRYGSIRNDEGFDISELLNLQNQFGDKFVSKIDNVKLPEKLFEIPCDLLIPGARTAVLTEEIAKLILNSSKPRAIVPVSNAPYTNDGLKLLQSGDIICFPDFIASAGAVIAAMIEFANAGGEDEALNLVEKAVRKESNLILSETKDKTGAYLLVYDFAVEKSKKNKEALIKQIIENPESLGIQELANRVIGKYLS